MRLKVLGCSGVGGIVDAPASLWDALVKLALVAIKGEGRVEGVPASSRCIRSLLDLMRGLGFDVRLAAGVVEAKHVSEPRRSISVNIDCGLFLGAIALAVASQYLEPGVTLVLRARNERLLKADLRGLLEFATALGLRAWPGGSLSRLVIVEATSVGPLARPIKLYTGQGYIAAAALLALAGRGGTLYLPPWKPLRGRRRLEHVAAILSALGYLVETTTIIRVKPSEGKAELRVAQGYAETLLLAALVAPCARGGIIEVQGLPEQQWGDEKDVEYLLAAMGYNIERNCSRGVCSLKLRWEEPRSLTFSVEESPSLAYGVTAHAAAWGNTVVSGLATLANEVPGVETVEKALQMLGVEAYLEEAGDRLYVGEIPLELQEGYIPVLECLGSPLACSAAIALLHRLGKGAVNGVESLDDHAPGVLEAALKLGMAIDIA
ncbi:hypothetical protein [Hyperthermus butylicus]|uniref:3-phosphoshikimate 1-carboxyvinyltransferase n=1 Tax=Hyperthermus butylicus (strain DSM 5456 / JCM 9403 / PLM1-5) TaxID=415426 RepID=A2BL42_HYPBU|nr:hypothetical protein [Hyperthermus butylicus]ABM80703.1 hypothetical protein Hbut_0852 [Hyperthermus butylicus DSM 5456]